MGEGRKIHKTGDELIKYGQEHSDNGCTAHGYFLHGWGYMVEGVFPDAIESFRKGIQVAIEPLHAISAKSMLGYAYIGNGQYLEAENVLNEVNEYCSQFGYGYSGTPAKGLSGMVMITKGQFEQGIKIGDETVMTFAENECLAMYVAGSFLQGKVYLQIFQLMGGMKDFSAFGDQADFLKKSVPIAHDKAEEYFKVAINKSKEIGAKSYHGQACLDLGRLYKLQGRMDEARQYISDAVQMFERIEAGGFLRQAREELASL
jgi:tetratricopeptide (TPR) repeat protein